MDETLIIVEDLSKKFCKQRYSSMKYGVIDIIRNICWGQSPSVILRRNEFFVLEDVSFSVKRGECLGVLGPNGAGKTSLLKLILGVLLPDKGKITTAGEIAAILNRNAGLNMDLTGKENIYFCCSFYKKRRSEISKIFNTIVETAELGKFINDPLKTYSSGMIARLIFAITVNLEPDILLLDDVLHVGDLNFLEKSEYILKKIKKTTAMVFASHNVDELLAQADKILVLDGGHVKFLGDKAKAINHYYKMSVDLPKEISVGNNDIDIYDISFKSLKQGMFNRCEYGDPVNISFKLRPQRTIKDYYITFAIITGKNEPIIRSDMKNKLPVLEANIEKRIDIFIEEIQLVTGKYYLTFKFYDLEKNELLRTLKNAISFNVETGPTGVSPLNIDYEWKLT